LIGLIKGTLHTEAVGYWALAKANAVELSEPVAMKANFEFFIEVNYFLNIQNYSIDFLQYKAPKEIFKIRRSHIHFRLQEAFAKDQEVYSLQEDKKKKKKKNKKVNI
jgi:hypothetical protein